jgi:hypothetical protein
MRWQRLLSGLFIVVMGVGFGLLIGWLATTNTNALSDNLAGTPPGSVMKNKP